MFDQFSYRVEYAILDSHVKNGHEVIVHTLNLASKLKG
jgi:hypothetical protein